ncbi:hypothetical protein HK102_005511 [Quaeritorhiza haematococci]|nr:hypothetical protein HK102_005511 [Quaeritorhiza haematococci]
MKQRQNNQTSQGAVHVNHHHPYKRTPKSASKSSASSGRSHASPAHLKQCVNRTSTKHQHQHQIHHSNHAFLKKQTLSSVLHPPRYQLQAQKQQQHVSPTLMGGVAMKRQGASAGNGLPRRPTIVSAGAMQKGRLRARNEELSCELDGSMGEVMALLTGSRVREQGGLMSMFGNPITSFADQSQVPLDAMTATASAINGSLATESTPNLPNTLNPEKQQQLQLHLEQKQTEFVALEASLQTIENSMVSLLNGELGSVKKERPTDSSDSKKE